MDVAAARARAAEFLAACPDATARSAVAVRQGRGAAEELAAALATDVANATAGELVGLLGWLDDLRQLESEAAGGAVMRAAALQTEAGHWGAAEAPKSIAITGMLAGHLAKSSRARLELLDAAGDWLAARFSPDLLQGFQWENIAAYAHTFANLSHDGSDEILQWCGRELERGVRARKFSAVSTARVLVWCDAPVLPGASFGPEELVAAILSEQASDGGFGEASAERAGRTWDAWIALEHLT